MQYIGIVMILSALSVMLIASCKTLGLKGAFKVFSLSAIFTIWVVFGAFLAAG